jgi:hypothetical protein
MTFGSRVVNKINKIPIAANFDILFFMEIISPPMLLFLF